MLRHIRRYIQRLDQGLWNLPRYEEDKVVIPEERGVYLPSLKATLFVTVNWERAELADVVSESSEDQLENKVAKGSGRIPRFASLE
ncbi:hypothetical protein LIER_38228 [Lithospermum erythrorhizon]|uniref:Uncharacterized protein n=1 Tax=Lithospermum erythrorhizon TaxID=34254 RepID=A0AAV3PZ05_LITER